MKNSKILFVIAAIALCASCMKASEKASGTYNGTYSLSSNYAGPAEVVPSGDKVNMVLKPSIYSGVANGVTVTLNGENVSFDYLSNTTTNGEATEISGTLTGNTLNFSFGFNVGTNILHGTFSGNK